MTTETDGGKNVRAASYFNNDIDETFVNPPNKRTYTLQYNSIYTMRTKELKKRVMKIAHSRWHDVNVNKEKPKYVSKVLDVPFMKPVFIIGTTLADMKYKPDVLKEVELNVQGHFKELNDLETGKGKFHNNTDDLRKSAYSDPNTDKLWLEDESGRILLSGDHINDKILVSGLVMGVLGMEVESGIFHVVDIAFPDAAPQKPLSNSSPSKILLCSGLNYNTSETCTKYEVLKNWIMGELDDPRVREITDMLVVGNSVNIEHQSAKVKTGKDKYSEDFVSNYNESAVRYVDELFNDILHSIPISVFPGTHDIVEVGLPKQPIHKSLFHKSSARKNFKRLTDPSFVEINGVRILSSSGENVNDILKYIIPNINVTEDKIDDCIATDSRLRIIEDTLLWQIIAPTAPDTLWTYPFEDRDPFTLTETPHIYIVGNQPKFECSLIELKRSNGDILPVRIIAIPEFNETSSCVLLDLKTFKCELVSFDL